MPYRRDSSGCCELCGEYREFRQRDHRIPKFQGGSNTPDNIQWLCPNCHADKSRKEVSQANAERLREPMSQEIKAKISAALSGKVSPQYGVKRSAATKARQSESMIKHWAIPGVKERRVQNPSEETKRKIGAAVSAYWKKRNKERNLE